MTTTNPPAELNLEAEEKALEAEGIRAIQNTKTGEPT